MSNYKCPIACGHCCRDSWTTVIKLEQMFKLTLKQRDYLKSPCPFLSPNGCRLPRKTRPKTCLKFLCDLGGRVYDGSLDMDTALKFLAKNEGNPLDAWYDHAGNNFESLLTEGGIEHIAKRVFQRRQDGYYYQHQKRRGTGRHRQGAFGNKRRQLARRQVRMLTFQGTVRYYYPNGLPALAKEIFEDIEAKGGT